MATLFAAGRQEIMLLLKRTTAFVYNLYLVASMNSVLVDSNGTQHWYKNRIRHRENNMPVIIYTNGFKEWWVNGKFVRSEQAQTMLLLKPDKDRNNRIDLSGSTLVAVHVFYQKVIYGRSYIRYYLYNHPCDSIGMVIHYIERPDGAWSEEQ